MDGNQFNYSQVDEYQKNSPFDINSSFDFLIFPSDLLNN
jgi:hypothetical protein